MAQSRRSNPKRNATVYNIKYQENDGEEIELIVRTESEEAKEDQVAGTSSDVYIIQPVKEVLEHTCGICNRGYSTFYSLRKHMATCTKKKGDLIDESYDEMSLEEIEKLQVGAKDMAKRNICYCCEDSLESAHSGHIRCQDCPKSFKNVKSYRRHASFLHSSIANSFPCSICNAKCPTQIILDIHEEAHRNGKQFACQKCGKEFTRKYHLRRHQSFSNCDPAVNKPAHKCKVCDKEFFRIDNLRMHLRMHIGEDTKCKDYQCPYCGRCFQGTTTMNIHIRTHTGEKPFICDVCQRGFPSMGALRKHRRSHTGEKPFQCKVCERAFAAKEVLNRHMKTHTGERPHICTECGKGFIQATQLKAHMFHHTGENGLPCEKCGMTFNRKRRLLEHMTHFHSALPGVFNCIPCDVSFDNKPDLKSHISLHESDKLYKCRACNKKFLHVRNHVSCPSCKICSHGHKLAHDHVPIKSNVKPLRKKLPVVNEETDAKEDAPRKLKILTSKVKKPVEPEEKDIEIIITNECVNPENTDNDMDTWNSEDEDEICVKLEAEEPSIVADVAAATVNREETKSTTKAAAQIYLDDEALKDCVAKLLNLLLDQELLVEFGWPEASIEHVLSSVIKQCGHEPADYNSCSDYSTKIRENVKLLITVVIDNDSFKELLNNHSIDEVILQIVKMTSDASD